MSTQITRRYTIFGGSTLVATSLLAGEAPPPARAAELNPQPLPPSPGWARALPPGPDTRVKITEAYAKLVARDAYFWAWPLVNIFNRRQTFKDVTEIVMAGRVPPRRLTALPCSPTILRQLSGSSHALTRTWFMALGHWHWISRR
jgi:hypothetical protein